jgi:hypothetical protein
MSHPSARKIHTAPELDGDAHLGNVLSFNSPTRKKKRRKKKAKPKGAHFAFQDEEESESETDSEEEGEGKKKNPVTALLATRMATSPTSKKQLLKETAKRNAERKQREMLSTPKLEDLWSLVTEAGCTFYVNSMTGEATEENPFDERGTKFEDLIICKPRVDVEEISPPIATGAIAYGDVREDFTKVMEFLDGKSKTWE